MKKSILTLLAIMLVFGLALSTIGFIACDNGNGDYSGNGNSGNGSTSSSGSGIKGTSWEKKDIYTGTITSNDYTITISFTTDDTLTIKRVGWYDMRIQHVNGYNVTYTTERTNVNETFTGTYTYFSNIKEGYMNSDYWNINPWNFKILSDNKTMAGKLDTNQFTKK